LTTITSDEAKTLAKEAFLFGLPVVLVEKQFYIYAAVTKPTGLKSPVNQFGHTCEYPDASNRQVVGLNVDTLYSSAPLDLAEEPIVLSVPAMGNRYWIMQLVNAWNGVPAGGGTVSLYLDGESVGQGRVEGTHGLLIIEEMNVGKNEVPVSDDYGPKDSEFSGRVRWVQIDVDEAAEDLDHMITPEERLRVAVSRQ
jgi:hypothetical protein